LKVIRIILCRPIYKSCFCRNCCPHCTHSEETMRPQKVIKQVRRALVGLWLLGSILFTDERNVQLFPRAQFSYVVHPQTLPIARRSIWKIPRDLSLVPLTYLLQEWHWLRVSPFRFTWTLPKFAPWMHSLDQSSLAPCTHQVFPQNSGSCCCERMLPHADCLWDLWRRRRLYPRPRVTQSYRSTPYFLDSEL